MQELKAKNRTELGKRVTVLRKGGFLPAVVYGEGTNSQAITVSGRDFEKTYKEAGESTLLLLDVEGKKFNVLIHDVAYDPLTGYPTHADFYAVRMDRMIRTKVPISFINEAPAIKNFGGIPVKIMQEVEVEALPQNLPHRLVADLSSLVQLEEKLFVKNLVIPEGVTVHGEPEEIIFIIESPRSDAELATLKEAPVAEAPTETVKTEQEIKKAQAAEAKAQNEALEESR